MAGPFGCQVDPQSGVVTQLPNLDGLVPPDRRFSNRPVSAQLAAASVKMRR